MVTPKAQPTTKQRGDAGEDRALAHLQAAGLRLVLRNYRTPGRGGGEIDLIMRDRDGTLVFVEVRQRASGSHGGAGASISPFKQRRIVVRWHRGGKGSRNNRAMIVPMDNRHRREPSLSGQRLPRALALCGPCCTVG